MKFLRKAIIIIGIWSLAGTHVEGRTSLDLKALTITIADHSDVQKPKITEYKVRGKVFKEGEIIIASLEEGHRNVGKLLEPGGSLFVRMQDPVGAFMLYNELLKGGHSEAALDYLTAIDDPSVPEQIRKAYTRPDHAQKLKKRFENQKSVTPVLLTFEEEGLVVLYVWRVFGEERILQANRIKKYPSGWKMLPFLRSKESTPRIHHILEAMKARDTTDGRISMVIETADKD